jgi:hypothetical protein
MSKNPGCDPCDFGLFVSSDGRWNNNCAGSSGGCLIAEIYSPLQTEERDFHSPELRAATEQIDQILDKLRTGDPKKRNLTFLRVPGGGLMLAWSDPHAKRPSSGVITSDNTADEIKAAMGLISFHYDRDRLKSEAS